MTNTRKKFVRSRSNIVFMRLFSRYRECKRRWPLPKSLGVHAIALLAFFGGCVPLLGQPTPRQKATFLKEKEQSCESHLATGEKYEFQFRTFRWMRNNTEMYTSAVAYYAPSSGEFLWVPVGGVMTKDEYFRFGNEGKFACAVAAKFFHFLLHQDGRWVAFAAIGSGIRVYHSDLRFQSFNSGWGYVAEHPEEMSSFSDGRWVEIVSINKELGNDFFRPESLRFDARPFTYDPLAAVTKVGSHWQLEVEGADKPNKALVYLDGNFKLIKVVRLPAASRPTAR
jgi:hypothetical protein